MLIENSLIYLDTRVDEHFFDDHLYEVLDVVKMLDAKTQRAFFTDVYGITYPYLILNKEIVEWVEVNELSDQIELKAKFMKMYDMNAAMVHVISSFRVDLKDNQRLVEFKLRFG